MFKLVSGFINLSNSFFCEQTQAADKARAVTAVCRLPRASPGRHRCARTSARCVAVSLILSPCTAVDRQNLGGGSDECPRPPISGQLGSSSL